MSSTHFDVRTHAHLFRWHDGLDPADYVVVRYELASRLDAEASAIAMAMEQSAATQSIPGYLEPGALEAWTARVRRAEGCALATGSLAAFELATEVYGTGALGEPSGCAIEIAYPRCMGLARPVQLLNVVVGEIPRLGFVGALRVVAVEGLDAAGPRFGVAGLRQRLGVPRTPLLCRSMRPAVGLDVATMARLNEDVLVGGFHLVKDDELQAWPDLASYRAHVRAMAAARRRAEDASGQRKHYVANLICEPGEFAPRRDAALAEGADAFLVAPALQGLGVLHEPCPVPLLSHNTGSEMFTRHPAWSLADPAWASLQRAFGADLVVTPGPFGTPASAVAADQAFVAACRAGDPPWRAAWPILQGGKHPEGLPAYRAATATDDFMLIVASWVDRHPGGPKAGAHEFRTALDAAFAG